MLARVFSGAGPDVNVTSPIVNETIPVSLHMRNSRAKNRQSISGGAAPSELLYRLMAAGHENLNAVVVIRLSD